MVKNVKGGKGSKAFARKLMHTPTKTIVRVPENPLEIIAIVTKFYGNMCDVTTTDSKTYKCMIRKKFTGRFMYNSKIAAGNIIMVGLRDYEAPNFKTCDLLEVYDANDVRILANIPSINIQPLIAIQNAEFTSSSKSGGEFNVVFSTDAETYGSTHLASALAATSISAPSIAKASDEEDEEEEINPDDI